MQKITPDLWFDDEAEDAVNRYTTIFHDSEIGAISRYDAASAAASGQPEGSVMTVEFELEGQSFVALNGDPQFPFTSAISSVVNCLTTDEIAVRPGGARRFVMTGPNGDEYPNRIEYDEVEEPERLAYSHGSPSFGRGEGSSRAGACSFLATLVPSSWPFTAPISCFGERCGNSDSSRFPRRSIQP